MRKYPRTGSRSSDLIYIVQPISPQQILPLAQIALVRVQVGFAKERGAITRCTHPLHPGRLIWTGLAALVLPDSGMMRIEPGSQTQARRDANRRGRNAIGKAHPLGCKAVEIGRRYPTPTCTQRIGALLIGHQQQNIGAGQNLSFGPDPNLAA